MHVLTFLMHVPTIFDARTHLYLFDSCTYSTAQMQRRSCSHNFVRCEYTRVMFDVQVTVCYSRALERTNSQVIFPQDNRSSHSRCAKLRVWILERASETQPTREFRALETHPLESCKIHRLSREICAVLRRCHA